MLTQKDLKALDKLISTKVRIVIREEIEVESANIRQEFKSSLFSTKVSILSDIRDLSSRIKNLEISSRKISKDLKTAVNLLDKLIIKVETKVKKIEEKLSLQSL